MAELPTGTVSIMFTDIEGSTRLLQQLGSDPYGDLLIEHHRVLRDAIGSCLGVEIKTEGDSFFAVFPSAAEAIKAASQAQRELAATTWPAGTRVAVRMGIHTGDVSVSGNEYVGIAINRAARIAAAAHGGQVLLSQTAAALAGDVLPDGVGLRDLGEHKLKDIDAPEHLLQLVIDGLPDDFPPPRAIATRFELLPLEMSSFVGRGEVLARARELLGGTRLLTLTGPGGTGKTRLSLRLAREVADEYDGGVAFIELAPISDPGLVMTTIRQTLGLGEVAGQTSLATVIERIAGREVLLVLDNFEQVAAAADQVALLLERAPDLNLILTSRVPLHVEGEQEFAVPPLSVPSDTDATDAGRLAESEAVTLFVQRAQAVRPDFRLTADNARVVVAICRRLDGLPLAIELAASRTKLLPLRALMDRLQKSLDILQSTAADRTDRQRTLRGAIAWSYDLLNDVEKTLFRRCAVFVGGWRLEDAEAILHAAGRLGGDVLDGTTVLIDHSLVRRVDANSDVRLLMLETIREYGREQLALNGELEKTSDAHARHFASLAEEAEPSLTSGREWPDRLEADHANIRAALAWLADHDTPLALLTAGRLWRFWHLRGHLREGAALVSDLLDRPAAAARDEARAKALIGLAGLVYWQTDYELARRSYEEAREIAAETRNQELEVEALYSLAYVRSIERDWEGAERDLRKAESLYEKQGNRLMAAWALASSGMNATLRGDHETAVQLLEESARRFEELGDSFGIRNSLGVETRALMHLGHLDHARALNRRAVEVSAAGQDVTSLSATLHDAASLAALDGDLERAAILIGAARRIVRETGGQPPPELINRIDALPTLERDLEAERLAELLGEGERLTTEQAVELALAG